MSGRKHHHIPQLLQNGFASNITSDGRHQVWVLRKGQEPFRTWTGNAFAIRDFYGPPESPELDDALTAEEIRLDGFLVRARGVASRTELGHSPDASALIHQLSVRVRWIRDVFQEAMTLLTDQLARRMETAAATTQLLRRQLKVNPMLLSGEMEKAAQKSLGRPLTAEEQRKVREMAAKLEQHPTALDQLMAQIEPPPIGQLRERIPEAATGGHLRGLSRILAPEPTPLGDYMQSLHWVVVPTRAGLVLGDCGPLYFGFQGEVLGPMVAASRDEAAGLLQPLGVSTLLVGLQAPGGNIPEVKDINEASAGWSREAIIVGELNDDTRGAQPSIGKRLAAKMNTLIDEAFDDDA